MTPQETPENGFISGDFYLFLDTRLERLRREIGDSITLLRDRQHETFTQIAADHVKLELAHAKTEELLHSLTRTVADLDDEIAQHVAGEGHQGFLRFRDRFVGMMIGAGIVSGATGGGIAALLNHVVR